MTTDHAAIDLAETCRNYSIAGPVTKGVIFNSVIAEVEALREREKENASTYLQEIAHFIERAEAAEARVVALEGAFTATANILETLRKERLPEQPESRLSIFYDDRDRIAQAVLRKARAILSAAPGGGPLQRGKQTRS